jgi:integrase
VRAIEPLKSMLDAGFEMGEVIVKNSRGKPWTGVESFSSMFGKVTEEIGIKDLTFHDTRGSAVTRLSVAGCSIMQIAAVTGHPQASAQAILTASYLGGTAELAEQAMAILERRRAK